MQLQLDWVGQTILMMFLLVLLSIPKTAGIQTPVLRLPTKQPWGGGSVPQTAGIQTPVLRLQTKQPWGGGSVPPVGSAAKVGLCLKGMVQTPVLHELQNTHPWGGGIVPLVGSAVNVGLELSCTVQPWGRGINPLVGPEQLWSVNSSRRIIPISKVRIQNHPN